jgi:peptide deformylase
MRLCLYGNEFLHKEAEAVSDIPALESTRNAMEKMIVRYGFKGVAAPQVGISARLIVLALSDGRILDLVNPKITQMYGVEAEYPEVCISCPPKGNGCRVPRMQIIHLEAASVNAPEVREWRFKGEDARVIQHEMDHLTGTWFFDRADYRSREHVLWEFKQWHKKWSSNGHEFPY